MMIIRHLPSLFGASIEVYIILLILGVPVFFLWRWLLSKFIKGQRIRTAMTWIITSITTPVLYVGIVMLLIFGVSYHPSYSFDKEKWFANKRKRYELSEDIIERKMLLGKTKSEVRQLLGDEGNSNESDHWFYQLGLRPGLFNIDPDVLDIEFSNGKVSSVQQYES